MLLEILASVLVVTVVATIISLSVKNVIPGNTMPLSSAVKSLDLAFTQFLSLRKITTLLSSSTMHISLWRRER
jgi:hypothetical protein